MAIKLGSASMTCFPEDGRARTLEMLRQIAADLAESHERLTAYLAEAGFLAS